ncbi:MAG: hypothetical protein GEU80_05640 [Dehalococcoidia bacterium]|nr:hypothetical protein [Dehalococcoidia bacterium]
MDDPLTWWGGLPRPWKASVIALPVCLLLLRGLLMAGGWQVLFGIASALLWAAAIASIVRLSDRLRDRTGR